MDAQGKARSFPDPGAVLVDVSDLSVEERALILFRHARSGGLEKEPKELVRDHAPRIVNDAEFTPERMRRFVHESLPRIVSEVRRDKMAISQIGLAIQEALRNPTKQMRLTFQKLPPAYKWFLVALLEMPSNQMAFVGHQFVGQGNAATLQALYEQYCPEKDHEPFGTVMEHLREAFVKIRKNYWKQSIVDWIHPSYRDLVIEELSREPVLKSTFLRRASLEGVKLAVSDTGGRFGERSMPLIRSAENWDVLRERCLSLIQTDAGDREVLEIVANAASENPSGDKGNRWRHLLAVVCKAVQVKWDRISRLIPAPDLEAFARARSLVSDVQIPDLRRTWEELEEVFQESLRVARMGTPLDYEPFENLTAFAKAAVMCSPDFLAENSFPAKYDTEITNLLYDAESHADEDPTTDDPDEIRGVAGRVDRIAECVEGLAGLSIGYESDASRVAARLRNHSSTLEELASQKDPPEPDSENYRETDNENDEDAAFDIGLLFSELK